MTLRFGILTASDRSSRFVRPDASGPTLVKLIKSQGWEVVQTSILPDEIGILSETIAAWADGGNLDIILTTGGTGLAPRDVTPEATRAVANRLVPGLTEAMRATSLTITPHAMLSRAVAGIRGKVLIINLPGSPKAAVQNLQVVLSVLPHAVQLLNEDPDAEFGH